MTTRTELLSGVPCTAAFGMMAAMGLGLADTEGPEPWLAGALALLLAVPCLSIRIEPTRPALTPAGLREGLRGDAARRASAWGLIAVGLFIPHLALWLVLGVRFWLFGLLVAGAAVARMLFAGLAYARETKVPRWSVPPTVPLFLVQGAAAGLLGLSAVEGILGFPPSLVLWKAAMALLGLAMMSQLWESMAAEIPPHEPVRLDTLAATGRERQKALFWGAVGLGLAAPFTLAMIADLQTERVLLPLAFMLHLAGLALYRLLFLALAGRTGAQ